MRFFMDYDNIPNKGPLMLFKDNGDGTSSLATPDDVNLVIAKATAHLQKLCEEQKAKLDEKDKKYLIMKGGYDYALKQVEEQKGENKNLLDALTTLAMKENKTAMEVLTEITPTRSQLESQLATQTEMVRKLTEALKTPCDCYTGNRIAHDTNSCHQSQALNQERLGDGGKGE